MTIDKTIVTACDSNYIWGALLLIMSIKKFNVKVKIVVTVYDFTEDQKEFLSQFPDVEVIDGINPGKQCVCVMKPQAILAAKTDWVIWMDSDCIVTHDITDLLVTSQDGIQMRFREIEENATVYRNYYQKRDKVGFIPAEVLETWRSDVGEREKSRIKTVGQTNCFVIHKDNYPFIYKWQSQMLKVLPGRLENVYNKKDKAYSMTDESVFNSLFAFAKEVPEVSKYLLDVGNPPYLVHFGLAQKPWTGWNSKTLKYYNLVQELLEWTRMEGYALPPIPKTMLKANKSSEYLKAYVGSFIATVKYKISTFRYFVLRKYK